MLVELAGRTIQVKALPIGIPFDRFVQLSEKAPAFLNLSDDVKVILGVDRLDYTKGLVHRILAFEKFLDKYPEHREKVVLLQISVPSRTDVKEYKQLKDETELLIGRINGRFSMPNWSPIRYIYGCLSQEQLAALYRDCAVALVTPLRDGMNLVAKEFVACQIRTPGVLILSPFAGAGGTMHEALLVNPYELDEMANVLHRALLMPLDERELRMTQLRHREQLLDVNYWMTLFFSSMGALGDDADKGRVVDGGSGGGSGNKSMQLQLDDFDMYLSNHIAGAGKLSPILDYDGTLTHLTSHPDLAVMSEETFKVLQRLSRMQDVNIAIISGRTLDNVKAMVGIENVTYAGSHGIEILHPDGTNFVHPVPRQYEQKVAELQKALADEVCGDGAWVENKGVMLTYHYREVPVAHREHLERRAVEIFEEAGFEPHRGFLAIEGKPPVTWDQGRASIYILRTTYGVDWSERVRVVYAGNEDAMKPLQGIACTFRSQLSPTLQTAANYNLSGPDDVYDMLQLVENEMQKRLPKQVSLQSPTSFLSLEQNAELKHKTYSTMIIAQKEQKHGDQIIQELGSSSDNSLVGIPEKEEERG